MYFFLGTGTIVFFPVNLWIGFVSFDKCELVFIAMHELQGLFFVTLWKNAWFPLDLIWLHKRTMIPSTFKQEICEPPKNCKEVLYGVRVYWKSVLLPCSCRQHVKTSPKVILTIHNKFWWTELIIINFLVITWLVYLLPTKVL